MAREPNRSAKAGKPAEAEAARAELACALRAAGIQFPAMDVNPYGPGGFPSHGLIELGQVSAPVARALAAVIAKGASA